LLWGQAFDDCDQRTPDKRTLGDLPNLLHMGCGANAKPNRQRQRGLVANPLQEIGQARP
jgi:hypothetical protein